MKKRITFFILLGATLLSTLLLAGSSNSPRNAETEEGFIKITTDKKVGDKFQLGLYADGEIKVEGLKEPLEVNKNKPYTLTSSTIIIRGEVLALDCVNNLITNLEIKHSASLKKLLCSGNKLSSLDLSQAPDLFWLTCQVNNISKLDFSACTKLNTLNLSKNPLSGTLDISKNPNLEICEAYENNFEAIDLSNSGKLRTCILNDNQIKEIDLSKCTSLTKLELANNQLTTLDISHNTKLNWFYCTNNQLATIDVTPLKNLERLGISGNKLNQIDLSKNLKLKRFFCANNLFTSIDLSQNKKLDMIFCYGNRLKGEGLIKTINTLPDRTSQPKAGKFGIHQNEKEILLDPNICLKKEVALAKTRNWKAFFCDNMRSSYEGADPLKDTYEVTLQVGDNGSASLIGIKDLKKVPSGEIISIDTKPNAGYKVDKIILGDRDITKKKCFVVKDNLALSVSFKVDENYHTYAVSLEVGEGGTATIEGAKDLTKVAQGTILKVKATPNNGYELDKIMVGTEDITTTKSFKVTQDQKVKVTFKKKTFAVTIEKAENGTIEVVEKVDLNAVEEGTTLTLKATPAKGYELETLTANGKDIKNVMKVEIKEATTLKATFKKSTAIETVDGATIHLYPNPATNFVRVEGTLPHTAIMLYTMEGRRLLSAQSNAEGSLTLDLSAYNEGVYLLLLDGNSYRLVIRR